MHKHIPLLKSSQFMNKTEKSNDHKSSYSEIYGDFKIFFDKMAFKIC